MLCQLSCEFDQLIIRLLYLLPLVLLSGTQTFELDLLRFEEIVVERADGRPCDIAVHHLDAAERASALAAKLHARLDDSVVLVSEVGAVVGAHVGPGMVAVAVSPRPVA